MQAGDERVVFDVGDGSFMISRTAFRGPELLAGDECLLSARLGDVELSISTVAGT